MNTTLLIMAAGIGSRFGTGIKQLEPVDDANHIIMDYSIHDAIEAGFNHVVFIMSRLAFRFFFPFWPCFSIFMLMSQYMQAKAGRMP